MKNLFNIEYIKRKHFEKNNLFITSALKKLTVKLFTH